MWLGVGRRRPRRGSPTVGKGGFWVWLFGIDFGLWFCEDFSWSVKETGLFPEEEDYAYVKSAEIWLYS